MLFDLICKKDSDQLCDASQDQISIKGFLILRFAGGNPKAVFEVVDGSFHSGSDLIGIVPLLSPAHNARIST